jgi:hypothetical protein
MSNRKSKLAIKFPLGKWEDGNHPIDYESFLSRKYTGPIPKKILLKIIKTVFDGNLEYGSVDSDEKLSNFIFQIMRNYEYAKKFGFDEKDIEELKSKFKNSVKNGKFNCIKNISFSLDLKK